MSSVLAGGPSPAATTPPSGPSGPPDAPAAEEGRNRHTALTAIAGVGVLLLAMGVGVLIGRAGAGKQATPPAQVIQLGGASAGGASTGSGTTEATFTSDWPAGTKGFTIEVQTLPAGSTESAIQAAKSAATAKGVSGVGALAAEEFSGLGTGYVIYAGVYHTRAEATKALAGVKKSFPSASVKTVSVSSAAGTSGGGGGGSTGAAGGSSGGASSGSTGGGGAGKSSTPSGGSGSNNARGKSYEEKSKNLPDVVSTG